MSLVCKKNLLLVGKFANEEMLTLFGSQKCYIFYKRILKISYLLVEGNKKIASTDLQHHLEEPGLPRHLYTQLTWLKFPHYMLLTSGTSRLLIQIINLSRNDMVWGLPPLPPIQVLHYGLHQHHTSNLRSTLSSRPLELVHSNLCRPFPQPSLIDSRYILTFIDDYSRHYWVFFLATKSKTFDSFKQFRHIFGK